MPAKPPTILVVDDDPDLLGSLALLLRTFDARVLEAADGFAALESLRSQEVSLVLSDYRMPGMDGLELLGIVRREFPAVQRLIMTAYPDAKIVVAAANEAQVVRFVTKPIDPVALLQAIRDLLRPAVA